MYYPQSVPHSSCCEPVSSNSCHPNLRTDLNCVPAITPCHHGNEKNIAFHCQNGGLNKGNICNEQFSGATAHKCEQFSGATAHQCALGTIVENGPSCCVKGQNAITGNACNPERRYEINSLEAGSTDHSLKPCCKKSAPKMEHRICRCSNPDSKETFQCECGVNLEPRKSDNGKRVRFSEDVTYIDCDEAFKNLDEEDVKNLCRCCQSCVLKGSDVCVGKPVLIYELPEPKFEGESVTQKDFQPHETTQKEMPPWHPNIKDRWTFMNVPSLSETTYQSDFKPPPVSISERKPVYIAPPLKEECDPCKQLTEEFETWKITSDGPKHVHHSNCPKCDEELHRVHLHAGDSTRLPPQYQCHGVGHIQECNRGKFTICDKDDKVGAKYWWKRPCCESGRRGDDVNDCDVPGEMLKPSCPSYNTTYQYDFEDPGKCLDRRLNSTLPENGHDSGDCNDCKNFVKSKQSIETPPAYLCTGDPNQELVTRRGGII